MGSSVGTGKTTYDSIGRRTMRLGETIFCLFRITMRTELDRDLSFLESRSCVARKFPVVCTCSGTWGGTWEKITGESWANWRAIIYRHCVGMYQMLGIGSASLQR